MSKKAAAPKSSAPKEAGASNGATVKDVPAGEFIQALAAHFKKSGRGHTRRHQRDSDTQQETRPEAAEAQGAARGAADAATATAMAHAFSLAVASASLAAKIEVPEWADIVKYLTTAHYTTRRALSIHLACAHFSF